MLMRAPWTTHQFIHSSHMQTLDFYLVVSFPKWKLVGHTHQFRPSFYPLFGYIIYYSDSSQFHRPISSPSLTQQQALIPLSLSLSLLLSLYLYISLYLSLLAHFKRPVFGSLNPFTSLKTKWGSLIRSVFCDLLLSWAKCTHAPSPLCCMWQGLEAVAPKWTRPGWTWLLLLWTALWMQPLDKINSSQMMATSGCTRTRTTVWENTRSTHSI